MVNIIIASNNKDKVREIKGILGARKIRVISAEQNLWINSLNYLNKRTVWTKDKT